MLLSPLCHMGKAKLEALNTLIVIFSLPGNNFCFHFFLTLTIFTLAKLNIHRSEIFRTTNGLVSFSETVQFEFYLQHYV